MQFLSENHPNGCQIFGRFGFLETESEPNFGFLHIPSGNLLDVNDNRNVYGSSLSWKLR